MDRSGIHVGCLDNDLEKERPVSYAVDNKEIALEVDSHLGLVVEAVHQAIKGLKAFWQFWSLLGR